MVKDDIARNNFDFKKFDAYFSNPKNQYLIKVKEALSF